MEHTHAARTLELIVSNMFLLFVYDLVLLAFNVKNIRVLIDWSNLYILCCYCRSDVLGQFMPLVGVDWSQTGVAHLFSAIKVCRIPSMHLNPSGFRISC